MEFDDSGSSKMGQGSGDSCGDYLSLRRSFVQRQREFFPK
jgi:hypothetical protein